VRLIDLYQNHAIIIAIEGGKIACKLSSILDCFIVRHLNKVKTLTNA